MGSLLQKIIVVIIGLVMSVLGALSPEMIASQNQGKGAELAGNTSEETLATLRTTDGQAFARISVLWVEVDGRRVTDDAWGTGEVDEIRFKIGVKDVDGVALAVGGNIIDLHPTDIITVRMFRGDFSYRGMDTPMATVQLQGTVKTTVLNEGNLPNRVLTRVGEIEVSEPPQGRNDKVAYVVLTTGEKVDTVAVDDGGSRLFTEEAPTANDATNEPGNLLAKWIKLDGKLVREYTWGDGTLPKIEFEPAEGASRSVVLAFNGDTFEVASGERVIVEDFVGEYLAYQVSGGLMRLRLDGYARAYTTGSAIPVPTVGGAGAPLASFDFAPVSPKTTDTVQFHDASTDDGIIVFRQWDFGDNFSAVLPDPSHRYERPGTYEVTLTVTDNDLKSTNLTRTLIVRNAEPVTDFDFSPKIVTTDTMVAFTDHSYDSDGSLVNWSWDFGDGGTSFTRHPSHRFTRGGNVTVTLTTTDDLGARSSLSKVILVRNDPPLAAFTYSPGNPLTLDPVQFFDNSTDADGVIARWTWSFGDGNYGSGSSPVHLYKRPGLYTVTLTATDDGGDSDTASTMILVNNRPPFPDFVWTPSDAPAGSPITFSSTSSDPDGVILMTRWNFGDGSQSTMGGVVTHTFPSAGLYNVTITVTDNTLGTSNLTRTVPIANSAPRANMIISPNPTYRGVAVTFSDSSSDPDGDALVNWTWDLGDGAVAYGRVIAHTYNTISTYPITLTVRDDEGNTAHVTRSLRVLNRPPTVSVSYMPTTIRAGENVTFTAIGVDPDLPGGNVDFQWAFHDGPSFTGNVTVRAFPHKGNYTLTVRGFDVEGGISAPLVINLAVDFARPRVDFTWDPSVPTPNQLANFTHLASSANGPIRDWRWDFNDSSTDQSSLLPNPAHAFRNAGTYMVRLTVTDILNQTNFTEKQVVVNKRPHARFFTPNDRPGLGAGVPFTDNSTDDDGMIVNWTWEFGDGTFSYERHPAHPGYATPGGYLVRLTVTDDRGTTNTTSRMINVANSPPVARWTYDSGGNPLRVGNTIYFNGYDLSYDPDDPGERPLASYSWNFGDLTPESAGANLSHIYAKSGKYTVGLTVKDDGGKVSERDAGSHKELRIGANHDVHLVINAVLPDGSPAPIVNAPYAVSVKVNNAPLDGGAYLDIGNTVDARVGMNLWIDGELATVTITAPFLTGVNQQTVTLRDGILTIPVNFTLRMPVVANLTPDHGQRVSLLAVLGADDNYSGDPLYSDMTEKPHGWGAIRFADGSPAKLSRVDIEARWVPLRAVGPIRNTTETPELSNAFPNWCKAGTATSDAFGAFSWSFDGNSQCYLNGLLDGVYPVGRWEVRARPQVASAENRLSQTQVFYVDPTGGIVLKASMGLA